MSALVLERPKALSKADLQERLWPGTFVALFQADVWTLTRNQVYAVTKDGQRFLVNATPQKSSSATPLTVVLNWTAALNK